LARKGDLNDIAKPPVLRAAFFVFAEILGTSCECVAYGRAIGVEKRL